MLISLAVLLIPVVIIYWFFSNDGEPEIEVVELAPVLAKAEAESPYPVLYAAELGDDWYPVRAAWAADGQAWITGDPAVGNSWQVGYLSPTGLYFGLQQRDRQVEAFITEITRSGKPEGEVTLAGRTWERYVSDDERTRSLVWRSGDMAAVLTADTTYDELEAVASLLTES